MTINRKLLPMKAHYFLSNSGASPIVPFIPTIAKDLGFSSLSVGWIFTVAPIITILVKPLLGGVADKYKCDRILFLLLLVVHMLSGVGIKWAPPLPQANTINYQCGDNILVKICSDKLREECFSHNLVNSLTNSTIECKIVVDRIHTDSSLNNFHNETYTILQLGLLNITKGESCIYMSERRIGSDKPLVSNPCENSFQQAELHCQNKDLEDLIKKTVVKDTEVASYYQFWILSVLILTNRISMTVCNSIGDAICFYLLGDKPENYGLQRLWGAMGWGLWSVIAGLIVDRVSRGNSQKNYTPAFVISFIFLTLDFIVSTKIKVNKNYTKQNSKSISIKKDFNQLIMNPQILVFLIWCTINGIFQATIWNFLFWFIEDLAAMQECGNRVWIKTLEGLVLTVQCYFGEIPFFFASGWILKKIGHINTMTLVLFSFGIRFLLYSLLTDPWWILPIEVLNGITFGLFYATMTTYANAIAPKGTESTVQSVVQTMFDGIGVSIGSLLGGYMFKNIGGIQTVFILGISGIAFGCIHIFAQFLLSLEKHQHINGHTPTEKEDEEL